MASAIHGTFGFAPAIWVIGAIGSTPSHPAGAIIKQRLPTDSIGNFTLTLTNLVVGSAIRIEVASTGSLVEFRTAASATEVFTIPAYSVGSALNDLRIAVRKGSAAPKYQPFETQATASVGSQSIFIAQVADPIA